MSHTHTPIPSTRPVRFLDGSITYVVTFTRDTNSEVSIDKIYKFDDLATACPYGEPIRFADLPDYIRLRYWRLFD